MRNDAVRSFISAFENDMRAFRNTLHPAIEWFAIEENRTPTRGIRFYAQFKVRNGKVIAVFNIKSGPPPWKQQACRPRPASGQAALSLASRA